MAEAEWIARTKADMERLEGRILHQQGVVARHRAAGRDIAASTADYLLELMCDRLAAQKDRLAIYVGAEVLAPDSPPEELSRPLKRFYRRRR